MKNILGKTLLAGLAGLILAGSSASLLPGEVITIMAANLSSGKHQAYEDPGIRILRALKPDVVLIQEFNYERGPLRALVAAAFGPGYYYMVEKGSPIPNGVVSRWPIISSGQWEDTHIGNRDFAWAVIDIPGEKHLQAVSVHLKSRNSGTQDNEARLVGEYVRARFDPGHYIVVGGDLNTASRDAAAIGTFETFLADDDHTPADRNGNSNTNEPRNKPYDWVMPGRELNRYHATLHVGTADRPYPDGIVFDSRVYPDLSEVAPVRYEDSGVFGMQHMAVMKAFDIPVSPPAPSPAPRYIVNEGFDDFQLGARSSGWDFIDCGRNNDIYAYPGYHGTAAPALQLNATGDVVGTAAFRLEKAGHLTFWARGVGTESAGSLLVEEFYDAAWKAVTAVDTPPAAGGTLGPFPVNPGTTALRLSYARNRGNLALDDVRITAPATPAPSPVS